MMNSDVLQLQNIHYTYPDGTVAVKNISFNLKQGQKTALFGQNGAGKTTVLHLLAGLIKPQKGKLELLNETPNSQKGDRLGSQVGLLFQNPDDQLFNPTLWQDVTFGPRNLGYSEERIYESAKKALEMVAMWRKRDKEPWRLSFGEKKRGALATVLAMQPDILLLDEPTTFLDSIARRTFINILTKLKATMIMATQDIPAAYELCSNAMILDSGEMSEYDSIERLLRESDYFNSERKSWAEAVRMGEKLGWRERQEGKIRYDE